MPSTNRQGVRDLNGPRLNGTGYNGHKSATCAHHRAPDLTPTHIERRTELVTKAESTAVKIRWFTCCSACGVDLYENE